MENNATSNQRGDSITKVILIFVFFAGFALFVLGGLVYGPGLELFKISALDLVLRWRLCDWAV